jgi:hypothetical protein
MVSMSDGYQPLKLQLSFIALQITQSVLTVQQRVSLLICKDNVVLARMHDAVDAEVQLGLIELEQLPHQFAEFLSFCIISHFEFPVPADMYLWSLPGAHPHHRTTAGMQEV